MELIELGYLLLQFLQLSIVCYLKVLKSLKGDEVSIQCIINNLGYYLVTLWEPSIICCKSATRVELGMGHGLGIGVKGRRAMITNSHLLT